MGAQYIPMYLCVSYERNFPSLTVLEDEPPQTTGVTDELIPPVQIHSRASISEQDDHLPPLRPTRSLKSRSMGQRKMLVASYSDAADSAVSMVSWRVVVRHFLITVSV